MRKYLLLLLAGAAAPALSAPDSGDRHGWQSRHEWGTQSKSEDRGDRSRGNDRVQRNDRGNSDDGARAKPDVRIESHGGGGNDAPQPVTPVQSNDGGGGSNADARFHNGFRSRFSSGGQAIVEPNRRSGGDTVGTVRRVNVEDRVRPNPGPKIVRPIDVAVSPTLRQPNQPVPRVFRNRVPVVSDTPREGTQPRLRTEHRRTSPVNWTTTWRNDRKYDWKDHRRRHRSLFHLGFYYDPFGWSYRPYQIGWRLWPSYYSSRYWINDPWQYRLPYAPPGTRWIRYYDDAVLIDTWTGQVVDVIYNFFW
jgi:Ni/Co efflux regulator RcnB